jgi:hypothetical protein
MNRSVKGILVASDEKLEWLLPWWWARYEAHNDLPVAFVDFGMSHFGRSFCKTKGALISLDFQANFTHLPPNPQEKEEMFGKSLWKKRGAFLKKPFAALSSPFEETLWLDIDTEVLGNLDPLFGRGEDVSLAFEPVASMEIGREKKFLFEDEILYNSGVILFRKDSPLIEKWAQAVLEQGNQFFSDQHVLSRLIYKEKTRIGHLHENYNWRMSQGMNPQAKIIHWVGDWGKQYIRLHGGIADELIMR